MSIPPNISFSAIASISVKKTADLSIDDFPALSAQTTASVQPTREEILISNLLGNMKVKQEPTVKNQEKPAAGDPVNYASKGKVFNVSSATQIQ